MECQGRWTTVAVVVLLTSGLAGHGLAQPSEPHPGPSQPVREQNLDATGAVRVHEQGTAKVDVTNAALNVTGTVSLGNSTLDVNVLGGNVNAQVTGGTIDATITGGSVTARTSPATAAYARNFVTPPDETESATFATINATAIYAHSVNDSEVLVRFDSPLAPSGLITLGTTGGAYLTKGEVITFPQPVPISGVFVVCGNGSFDCSLDVAVIGTAAP